MTNFDKNDPAFDLFEDSEYGEPIALQNSDGYIVRIKCGNCGSDYAYEGPDGNVYCWCYEEEDWTEQ